MKYFLCVWWLRGTAKRTATLDRPSWGTRRCQTALNFQQITKTHFLSKREIILMMLSANCWIVNTLCVNFTFIIISKGYLILTSGEKRERLLRHLTNKNELMIIPISLLSSIFLITFSTFFFYFYQTQLPPFNSRDFQNKFVIHKTFLNFSIKHSNCSYELQNFSISQST